MSAEEAKSSGNEEAVEQAASSEADEALEPEIEQEDTEETSEAAASEDADTTDSAEASDDEASTEGSDEQNADDQVNVFDAIKQEVTDLRDRYARLQAEWDNYRKRTAAEREAERVRASESLVKDLLPVLDDLERALQHAKDTGEGGSLTEGVEAIQTKFLQILGKHKVEQIEAQGEPFDVNLHQAVSTAEDDSVPEETVVQVFQQGYMMGDKVLRPAMVVTSVGGPARTKSDSEESDE
jgi:molecular chaperone GrpE